MSQPLLLLFQFLGTQARWFFPRLPCARQCPCSRVPRDCSTHAVRAPWPGTPCFPHCGQPSLLNLSSFTLHAVGTGRLVCSLFSETMVSTGISSDTNPQVHRALQASELQALAWGLCSTAGPSQLVNRDESLLSLLSLNTVPGLLSICLTLQMVSRLVPLGGGAVPRCRSPAQGVSPSLQFSQWFFLALCVSSLHLDLPVLAYGLSCHANHRSLSD